MESLFFLEGIIFPDNGYFKPIGSYGWMTYGQMPAAYDEQLLEAAETIMAYLEAYCL